MNARVKAHTAIDAEEAQLLRDQLTRARVALSRVFYSASMMRENVITPHWQRDLSDPALAINAALSAIESQLNLEQKFLVFKLQREGSAES